MSELPPPKLPPVVVPVDDRQVDLVRKIHEKTVEGKIYWNRNDNGSYTARISTVFKAHFDVIRTLFGVSWSRFAVSSDEGNLVVEQNDQTVFSALTGVTNPLYLEISSLYSEVRKVGEGKIDRAIKLLDDI